MDSRRPLSYSLRTCAHISGESAKKTELSRARPALHAACRTPVRYRVGSGAPGPSTRRKAETKVVSRTALALGPSLIASPLGPRVVSSDI